MVVACPKCKSRLNVPDERIKPEGSRFKCPKCAAVLMVRRPAAEAPGRGLDKQKVLVAHASPAVVERIKAVFQKTPYQITVPVDGVDTLVRTLEELPFLLILDIGLPKINGFEITRRIRGKEETKSAKIVLISSSSDPERQPRQPASEYGVDAYVDEENLEKDLMPTLHEVMGLRMKVPENPRTASPQPPAEQPSASPAPSVPVSEEDPEVARARRLARIVLSDIDLYSPDKVLEAVRTGSFQSVFADDLREGLRHYEGRISQEVRNKGNFFQEAIDEFVKKKKQMLGK